MRFRTVVIFASLTWCLSGSVHGTTLRGSLGQKFAKGDIIPIPGLRVTLTDGNRTLAEAYSGYDGKYYISNIAPRDYLLEVWFASKRPSSFIIHAHSDPYTDIGLLEPDNDKLNTVLRNDMVALLQPFRHAVYLWGRIPAAKEVAARRSALVPTSELILGLIDETLTGTAVDCIVFTQRGIYYHTALLLERAYPKRGFIRYQDLPGRQFGRLASYEVSLGDNEAFSTARADVDQQALLKLLEAIQAKTRERLSQIGTPNSAP
jgi:hypothetical protein